MRAVTTIRETNTDNHKSSNTGKEKKSRQKKNKKRIQKINFSGEQEKALRPINTILDVHE